MSAILEIRDLRVEAQTPAGARTAIAKGISFDLRRGEVVALIGESGSGKTTTCLAILGYARSGCRIVGGSIRFEGTDILALDREQRRRLRGAHIAYIAQSAAASFNPALTLGSQVVETALIHGTMSLREAESRAQELYRRLDLPDPARIGRLYPHQVSGGQLQRVMAAMAVIAQSRVLLLDEPTTSLDVTTQIEVLKAFRRIVRDHDVAAIYVSHDLAVVAQIADRVIVMRDGELLEEAPAQQILTEPRHEYTRELIAAVRRVPATASAPRQGAPAGPSTESRPPLLELRSVSAGYGARGSHLVLRDVTFALPRASTVGIIGESGSGKSTLARVIAGLLPPVGGQLFCDGAPLEPTVRRRARAELRRIQIVFQMADVALNPRHRVADLLARPFRLFVGAEPARVTERVEQVLNLVELSPSIAARYPHELSGGQKQRVNLARALIAEPDAILCDEVTSSLDTLVGAAIIDLLGDLQKRLGLAYLFISHDISTVATIADRIVVLYAGRVVEQGPSGRVLAPPHHPYTRLLLRSVPELRTRWLDEIPTSPLRPPQERNGDTRGCPFHARCPLVIPGVCEQEAPPVHQFLDQHQIACHREPEELFNHSNER